MSHKFLSLIVGLLFALAFSLLAFSEPTQAPPQGNVATPINTGNSSQDKIGWLTFEGGGTRNTTLLATAGGNVGIGTVSPNPRYKLDIAGTVAAANFAVTGATGGRSAPRRGYVF